MATVDRTPVAFGILALTLGVGVGCLMYAHPEGLNPDWNIWVALLAPAAFVLAGMHMIANGLGYARFSGAMLSALVIVLWAIANWATFFTSHIRCVGMVSFAGVAVFGWTPGELECRNMLQMLVASLDGLVIVVFLVFAWKKFQSMKHPDRGITGSDAQ